MTVTTDEQSGSTIDSVSTTTGGTIASSPGTPTRSGYTFNGWFTTSTGGSAITFPYTHGQTANFTLYAQWSEAGPTCANGGACAVGDTGPGGGIVFYVHDDADDLFTSTGSDCNTAGKYLEAAPYSGQVSRTWSTGANQSLAVSGADATGIGNGFQNTVDIVNQSGNNSDTSAAVYANSYSNNGKNDWYLPSHDELNQMCRWVRNQAASNDVCTSAGNANTGPGASGFTGEYWSSTENDSLHAYMQTMDYADRYGEVKFGARMVRPIRAFG